MSESHEGNKTARLTSTTLPHLPEFNSLGAVLQSFLNKLVHQGSGDPSDTKSGVS